MLSTAERAELQQLRAELTSAVDRGGLSAAERAELESLRTELTHAPLPASTRQRTGTGVIPVDVRGMGTMERIGRGALGGIEDIGLGALQLGQDVLGGGPMGDPELEQRLRTEAITMAARKAPLYDTTAGTIGQILPSLVIPGRTLSQAVAGGMAYGALQPEEEEGERLKSAAASGAAFGAGSLAARGLGALVTRARAPARGARPPTAQEAQRAAEVREAEDLGLKVSVGGRTGGRFAKGLESVFEDLPVTSRRMRGFREANQAAANQRLAEQFGSDAQVLTGDVLTAAKARVGAEFERFVTAKAPIAVDGRFMIDMKNVKRQVTLLPKEFQDAELKAAVKSLYDDIEPLWRRGNVWIDGERYKLMRSALTDRARASYVSGKRKTARQLDQVVDALDAMAGRSVPKDQQAAYKAARRQWLALRVAEESVDESGNVVRGKLNQAIKRHVPKVGTGKDIYRQLSRGMRISGEAVPNSGTPLRALAMASLASPALALTGIPGIGGETTPLDVAQGLSVPLAVQALMLNPRSARYITRHLDPGGPLGNSIAELLRRSAAAGAYGTLQDQFQSGP